LKQKPADHKVKFCILKKDLNELNEEDAKKIAKEIKEVETLRSDLIDIDSYALSDLFKHFDNMMPFISGPSFGGKDALRLIINEAERLFYPFPANYFREGYGPRPKGAAKFMFITNPLEEGRTKEAFLILDQKLDDKIRARTPSGVQIFEFSKRYFLPSLRTPVGLWKMDVTDHYDFVAKEPYERIEKVMELSGFGEGLPEKYWEGYVKREFRRATSRTAVIRRINPFSPNQRLIAFHSNTPLILSDLFHVVDEQSDERAKAVVVLLNSIFFLAYFFNAKEETTGRYTEVRQYDLYGMKLYPRDEHVKNLANVFDKYKEKKFPSLREQLDINFDERYKSFWVRERKKQTILSEPSPLKPDDLRLSFDVDVIKALNAKISKTDLLKAYEAIIWDMIITRGLRRD